jgi:serine protease
MTLTFPSSIQTDLHCQLVIDKKAFEDKPMKPLTLFGLAFALFGCSQDPSILGPGQNPLSAVSNGTISGTVRLEMASTSTARTLRQTAVPIVDSADFVPGEVIVTWKADVSLQALGVMEVDGAVLKRLRSTSSKRSDLYRAEGLDRQGTLRLIQTLALRPQVARVQVNHLFRATSVPNDPDYSRQWHYRAINLEDAWDITEGSSDVTVAVVDSGVLSGHPDLKGKLYPGYDMVSDLTQALDGDGRDANPEEPATENDSFHGSHVAGIIAANSNDGQGTAGVSWGARILPVRVLGWQVGSTLDIIDGLLWAAGVRVQGTPINAHPASVINLSLGAKGSCVNDPLFQEALDQVHTLGVSVVVAAGNDGIDARGTTPASCEHVITVGATTISGARATYSNDGPAIAVMAPGGDTRTDLNGDGLGDGVVSSGWDRQSQRFVSVVEAGTSMAAPHVSGLIALLKSVRPSLLPDEALAILTATAHDLSRTSGCQRGCGAGLIDAGLAVRRAQQIDLPANHTQATVMACVWTGQICDSSLSHVIQLSLTGQVVPFAFSGLSQRPYSILAWIDSNHNGLLEPGDAFGKSVENGRAVAIQPPATGVQVRLTTVQAVSVANTSNLNVPLLR